MRIDQLLAKKTPLTFILYPFSLIFGLVVQTRRLLYEKAVIKRFVPNVKTISIGNIVGGGSGKTPFTIYLVELLTERGYKVAVSHRGYKGEYENTNTIIADRKQVRSEAKKAGDEPLLYTKKLPKIPIIVGKQRKRSIEMLQQTYNNLDLFAIISGSISIQLKCVKTELH